MKIIFFLVLFGTTVYSQTISVGSIWHKGYYATEDTINGHMSPTLDWEASLYIPITEKFAITPSVYYYNATYKEQPAQFRFYEKFWYVGITFEYTFSEEPIFD